MKVVQIALVLGLTCSFITSSIAVAGTPEAESSIHVALPQNTFSQLKTAANLKPGEVLYVDFWASWCGPCRKSFPWMEAMQEKYSAKGFKILAVNLDKEAGLAEKFLRDVPHSFPIYYDPEGKLASVLKISGMPSSFIVDSDGKVLASHAGFFEKKMANYEQQIVTLLK